MLQAGPKCFIASYLLVIGIWGKKGAYKCKDKHDHDHNKGCNGNLVGLQADPAGLPVTNLLRIKRFLFKIVFIQGSKVDSPSSKIFPYKPNAIFFL